MQRSPKFDVVVVGGGPAGSAAAFTLAASGLTVALVDKARFPREKLCGGLLSQRSKKLLAHVFGETCSPPIEVTSSGAKLFFGDKLLNEIQAYKPIYFTSRRNFDNYLLSLAVSRGVDVVLGVAVTGLSADHRRVYLDDGSVLEARFVIGADGASSRIRKELHSVSIDKGGFAVGLEMEVPREPYDRDFANPEIYFGVVRWGYGWVFPKRDTLTVGVGGLAAANEDIRDLFRRFARMALGRIPDQPLNGHPIPFGNYVANPGEDSVLLVGDAAGLVEPITGEGIAFAIQSGQLAAEAIIESEKRENPSAALELYRVRYKTIARLFDDAKLLRYLVFSRLTEPLFATTLKISSSAIKKHMDVLAGDADYRDYLKFLVLTAVLRLPKLVRRLAAKAL